MPGTNRILNEEERPMRDRKELPHDTPENLGIPSGAIRGFYDTLRNESMCMHGVLLLRHGRIASEAYWKPFDYDSLHRMYSCSKSFVSVAVGCLAAEGKLDLDDPVVKFFPDKAPKALHPYIAQTTLRDLLKMATPHRFGKVTYRPEAPDWAATFFDTPPTHLPGKIFSYDTTATVMLTILAERIAGMPFLEYLRPRLFEPMGCSPDMDCIETPDGYSWGGSGVLCTARDFAKFALVCMREGRHNGQQLLPSAYLLQAVSRQIDTQEAESMQEKVQGYGYQFWRISHNGFACLGMGGQFAICLPEKDFILITTADTQGVPTASATIFNALWKEVYPYLSDHPLPADPAAQVLLKEDLRDLSLPLVKGKRSSSVAARVSGKTYHVTPGELQMRTVRFAFENNLGTMEYENDTGRHELRFGFGHQHRQSFPETHYYGKRIGVPLGKGYDCHNSAAWVDENSLVIRTWITDIHIGNLKTNAVFDSHAGTVTVLMSKAAEWFLDGYSGFASGHEQM